MKSLIAILNLNARITLVVMLLGQFTFLAGCRGFGSWNRKMGTADARQFSLRGANALQGKEYDDAEALFSEALRRSPMDERAHWGMAEVQAQKGNCQAAALHMQEASRLSGNNPDLLVRLGEMHLDSGQIDLAIQQADLALNTSRQHSGAWHLRGKIHQQQQQWQEAVDCYHRALMSKPNNPEVQLALAGIYHRMGRPQRALATLERLSDLQSSEIQLASVFLLKGQALASLGQADDAKSCMREAILRASPSDYSLFLMVAQLQTELGQIAEARINLGRALNLQPTNSEALALQSRLDQRFASLVAAGLPTPTVPTIDSNHPVDTELEPGSLVPARTSVYQIPRN